MRKRDALLSARSYLTILLGFLLGFAIVVWVEKQMPTRVESSAGISLSNDFPPLPAPRELTFEEAIWARVARQYYVNNTQPNGTANARRRTTAQPVEHRQLSFCGCSRRSSTFLLPRSLMNASRPHWRPSQAFHSILRGCPPPITMPTRETTGQTGRLGYRHGPPA